MIRARDLGLPFEGEPGPNNAITDVAGTTVGHTTLISSGDPPVAGRGPIRTGVTAILPRGRSVDPVFAGWYALNGNGEMTGTTWVEESGFLEGPLMITNTHSVGIVRDAVISWLMEQDFAQGEPRQNMWALPVVAETYDGYLNDINGFHVTAGHAHAALSSATAGAVPEGNVGGGTGMICHSFKGGIGTSSRVVVPPRGSSGDWDQFTLGVLVQANHGRRARLTIAGAPVGREIPDLMPFDPNKQDSPDEGAGSIIVVVATDAPLLPHQLKRLARRVPLGIGLVGGLGENSSGDIFLVYSTANPGAAGNKIQSLTMLANNDINALFEATIQATEEAIVNALVAAETMVGLNGRVVQALPHDRLLEILGKYNR
jgi:D-aminopeptidase